MNEVVKFLEKNPVQYLATVGEDSKPKVRPFMFNLERDGKLYFCTNNQKPVYKQIKKVPYVEVTTASPEFAWIRLSGKVVFSDDMEIKKAIIEGNEIVKSQYQKADNPTFEIFYIEEAKAVIADFSGEPPKEYIL
jgi:uncharacterized pyridoxamine 5'-phosphate oxidase family protein